MVHKDIELVMEVVMKTDVCLRCPLDKATHPISDLVKDRTRKTGYKRLCKSCNNKRNEINRLKNKPVNSDNMYATGVDPEVREAIMKVELPIWEERFKLIAEHKLSIKKVSHVPKIDKLLAMHGLS